MSAKKEEESLEGWEIPSPSAPTTRDPWKGPGHSGPLGSAHHANPRTPFLCRICGRGMTALEAYAYDGDVYCGACRPPQAVSGERDLPTDPLLTGRDPGDVDAISLLPNAQWRNFVRLLGRLVRLLGGW